MQNNFLSLKDAIEKIKLNIPEQKVLSERATLFKELYSYYEDSYKKNSWSNYIGWLKENHIKHSKDSVEQFKKTKLHRKQIDIKSFCSFWLGFIKTKDLYYLISIAKDKQNRNENFNKWLFWAIKVENTTTQNN